jgi:hypothetical protein
MNIQETNKGLIERILKSFDFEEVEKIYKAIGLKICSQQIKVEGLSKKDKTTAETIQKEIEAVLNFVISNDVPELQYGPWSIFWVNGEWEIELDPTESGGENGIVVPILESKLVVHLIPQSSTAREVLDIKMGDSLDDDYNEIVILETRLKKAIDNEEYKIASRIRDLLEELKK